MNGSATPAAEDGTVQFDPHGQLRLCDTDAHEHSTTLLSHSSLFLDKMDQFRVVVNQSLQTMQRLAVAIERVKLLAVGARCHADAEVESRTRQRASLEMMLKDWQRCPSKAPEIHRR